MKDKKVVIIAIIVVVLLVGVIGGVLLFKVFDTTDNDTNPTTTNILGDNELNAMIQKINKLNKNFHSGVLGSKSEYSFGEGLKCYRYSGTNIDEIKKSAEELYIDPIGDDDKYRMFSIVSNVDKTTNEEKEMLFVCLPDNCELTDITKAEIVEEKEDNAKLIRFNDKYLYYALNSDGKWKFAMPVSVCETTDNSAK